MGTNTVKFCIGIHVQKHNSSPLQTEYHITLNSPISAAYCMLIFFWHHLQEGLDVTTSDYFLWGHMKSLTYETTVESQEDLLAQVMTAADVGLQGNGDRVSQNMVPR